MLAIYHLKEKLTVKTNLTKKRERDIGQWNFGCYQAVESATIKEELGMCVMVTHIRQRRFELLVDS